jgi:cytochrome c oxidase subunit 2
MVVLMRVLLAFLLGCAATRAADNADRKPDRVIPIVAERFVFNPSKITVKQGDLVEFVISSDDTGHGFRVPGTPIDIAIPQSGKGEARVRFLCARKGRLVFECSRPCGAGHNLMRGELIVK